MSNLIKQIRLSGGVFRLTLAAQKAAEELGMTVNRLFPNLLSMAEDGSLKAGLTPTGMISKEQILEAKRRLDEFNSPKARNQRAIKGFGPVDELAKAHWTNISDDLRRRIEGMRNACDYVRGLSEVFPGLQDLEKGIKQLETIVLDVVVDGLFADWRNAAYGRTSNELVRWAENKFHIVLQKKGLDAAKDFLETAKLCLKTENPSRVLRDFLETGTFRRPESAPPLRRFPGPYRIDHKIVDLGNDVEPDQGVVFSRKAVQQPKELVLRLQPMGWDSNAGTFKFGTADGRYMLGLSSAKQPSGSEAHDAVCRIVKRDGDVIYVHYIRPVAEETKATA